MDLVGEIARRDIEQLLQNIQASSFVWMDSADKSRMIKQLQLQLMTPEEQEAHYDNSWESVRSFATGLKSKGGK